MRLDDIAIKLNGGVLKRIPRAWMLSRRELRGSHSRLETLSATVRDVAKTMGIESQRCGESLLCKMAEKWSLSQREIQDLENKLKIEKEKVCQLSRDALLKRVASLEQALLAESDKAKRATQCLQVQKCTLAVQTSPIPGLVVYSRGAQTTFTDLVPLDK
ncbi:uncharacterized protein [Diadema setosum]|uniref:uncharacterized protein n=1 Tax=Diadema setosum TaxID=31175 RepID=UPI003B3A2D7E